MSRLMLLLVALASCLAIATPAAAAPVDSNSPSEGLVIARAGSETRTPDGFQQRFDLLAVIEPPGEQGAAPGSSVIRDLPEWTDDSGENHITKQGVYFLDVFIKDDAYYARGPRRGEYYVGDEAWPKMAEIEQGGYQDVLRLRASGVSPAACLTAARTVRTPSVALAGEIFRRANTRISPEEHGQVIDALAALLSNPRTPDYVRGFMLDPSHWGSIGWELRPSWSYAVLDLLHQTAPLGGMKNRYENQVLWAVSLLLRWSAPGSEPLHDRVLQAIRPRLRQLQADLAIFKQKVEAKGGVWREYTTADDKYSWNPRQEEKVNFVPIFGDQPGVTIRY